MRLRSFVLSLTALVCIGGLAAPAVAETEVHRDPRGDAQRFPTERGVRTSADVVRLRGEHAGDAVRVSVDVVDLTGKPAFASFRFRTPTGADYLVQLGRDGSFKDVIMARFRRGEDTLVRCRGLVGRFFDEQDRMDVVVPRRCLNRPRWVRVGAFTGAASGGFDRVWVDDARRDGGARRQAFRPRLGARRLHRD